MWRAAMTEIEAGGLVCEDDLVRVFAVCGRAARAGLRVTQPPRSHPVRHSTPISSYPALNRRHVEPSW